MTDTENDEREKRGVILAIEISAVLLVIALGMVASLPFGLVLLIIALIGAWIGAITRESRGSSDDDNR